MRPLFWGMVLITFGILFLLDNLGYADFREVIHNYWPLILIVWGFSIVMRRKPHHHQPMGNVSQQVTSDLLHHSNVFGDIFTKITSSNFKGGSLSTVFGDCDVDLSDATFAEGDHELRIHSVFGDSHITLPKEAAASISANSVFGDLSILGQRKGGFSPDLQTTTAAYSSTNNRMKITITKVFGDIRVE